MRVYTIGFTKKSAQTFFELLRESGAKRVIDVRLNNVSQLAGFAKRDDLAYFLQEICGIDYLHEPLLTPTQEILTAFRDKRITWEEYERQFIALMAERGIEKMLSAELLEDACLLCSEDKSDYCHRRLVCEYLNQHWGGIEVIHLR